PRQRSSGSPACGQARTWPRPRSAGRAGGAPGLRVRALARLGSPAMILARLDADVAELASGTGWEVKPEGACKEDRCVPLPDAARAGGGRVDVAAFAERLNMALV